jgi:hypothetical protein
MGVLDTSAGVPLCVLHGTDLPAAAATSERWHVTLLLLLAWVTDAIEWL